jgi:excisionase family DNA binding protein
MSNNATHLTPGEVARCLGVSRRTLSRWHALRVGPPRVSVGRTILYRKNAVEAWLVANETQPTRSFSGGST